MILASPIQFAAIYPKDVVESASEEGIKEYIGTGPYKMAEWKQDQYVKLERYEDYQPSPNASTGLADAKDVVSDVIYFRVVTDSATRIAGVENGQYDIAEEIPIERYAELSEKSGLKLQAESGGTINLFLNTTEGIMANEKIRQAALAALNCDDILLAAYGDPSPYQVNAGWCNPTDKQWGTDAGSEYYNQNDVEKAKALLAEAGYNNEPIILVTTPDYAEMYNATLVVQEQLKQAGLDRPEVTEGITAIRSAETDEEAAKAWADLQTFLYEYGAATVLGHYTGVSLMNENVDGVGYVRFPIYWNATVSK